MIYFFVFCSESFIYKKRKNNEKSTKYKNYISHNTHNSFYFPLPRALSFHPQPASLSEDDSIEFNEE